jgi:uncharacterized repeat protein (TIGR01451 family)
LVGLVAFAGSMLAFAPRAVADTSAVSPGSLQLAISTNSPVLSGVASTYTITVTNTTTSPALGIQILNYLPAGMTLNNLNNPDVCSRTNKPLLASTAFNCTGGDLAPGATATVSFTATAAQPFLYLDNVQTTGIAGGVFTTNAVWLPIQVAPGPADIQVTGSASTGSPALGSTFSYTFQVKNNGSQAAYSVVFDDLLPPSLTLAGVATDTGTCSGGAVANSVHCDLGALAVGRQVKIVITAVAPATGGSITDTAAVSMSGPDTQPANNSVSVTVQPK